MGMILVGRLGVGEARGWAKGGDECMPALFEMFSIVFGKLKTII